MASSNSISCTPRFNRGERSDSSSKSPSQSKPLLCSAQVLQWKKAVADLAAGGPSALPKFQQMLLAAAGNPDMADAADALNVVFGVPGLGHMLLTYATQAQVWSILRLRLDTSCFCIR